LQGQKSKLREKSRESNLSSTVEVNRQIDEVKTILGIKTDNQLAGHLDVTRQALTLWRRTGNVPPLRAVQMEFLTDNAIVWRDLCPNLVEQFSELRA